MTEPKSKETPIPPTIGLLLLRSDASRLFLGPIDQTAVSNDSVFDPRSFIWKLTSVFRSSSVTPIFTRPST